jgi:hypothetical protein
LYRFIGRLNTKGVISLKGIFNHSKGDNLQVGEMSLPILSVRCHGLRKSGRKLISERIIGETCLPKRNHAIHKD